MRWNHLLLLPLAALTANAAAYTRPWVDFADFEAAGNCTALVGAATGYEAISAWDQEKLDRLYACSKAGPMPDGFLNGKVIFATGGSFDHFIDYAKKLGVPIESDKFKKFAETLWKGKHFYRKDRALLNKMAADVEPILGQNIQGQMRFPAKLFCGQSLLDGRRESIVIDYFYTDTVKVDGQIVYDDKIDWIAGGQTKTGKRGLNVRDEVRMVRPGLYLGRAYMDRVFVLNFVLSTETPPDGADQCWPGYEPKA